VGLLWRSWRFTWCLFRPVGVPFQVRLNYRDETSEELAGLAGDLRYNSTHNTSSIVTLLLCGLNAIPQRFETIYMQRVCCKVWLLRSGY